ncbi:YdcF family protein [Amycolatopsis sp. CA-230715]|uniref:YdcF family protein n=1 Tax=Amycolatopsis sp. CA-230715 TaxID=2745196 RepID=UPI001C025D32|nr:YdcF family protein [Amycolatopsis sp. CA-230715]QWF85083.1 hypothetical protein HUW46_08536 [Amycolatopsis sp. CA-230715]
MGFGLVAAAVTLIFLYRVYREPRRLSNAVWLVVALGFAGMWLLARLRDSPVPIDLVVAVCMVLAFLLTLGLPFALIANGAVMWRREGHRLANLLSLLAGIALFALYATTVYTVGFVRTPWIIATVVSMILVAGYFAVLFTAFVLYSALYSRLGRRTRATAVIVLGSGLLGDRVPPLLAARLDKAAECHRRAVEAGADQVLVVSGGQGEDEDVSEAEAMSAYLRRADIPAEAILLEDKATTTEQNLRYSADLLAARGRHGRLLAVTNNYHVFRTAVLSRRLKLPLDVIGARTASYFMPSAFLREFVALLSEYWRTNLAACVLLGSAAPLLALLGATNG